MRISSLSRSTRTRIPVAVAAAFAAISLAACSSSSSTESTAASTPASSAPASASAAASPAPSASATVAAFPATVANCGLDVTVAAAPTRAITMNQGATEVMLALGLEGSMVGTAYLDDAIAERWQGAYDSVPVLAAEYPNAEAVLDATPDFVYVSYASAFVPEAAGTQASLAELGIPSYVSPFGCEDKALRPPVAFDSVWAEIDDIGTLFGVTDRSDALVAEQRAALAAVADGKAGAGLDVFWYDSGDKTPFAGTGGGAPQLIIDSVGATNIFADIEGNWADVSWEQVVKADPDVIVLADASWSTAKEKQDLLESDPALKDLTAVKNQQYAVLPFSETTPGVRLVDGVESLAEQITQLTK